MIQVEHVSKSFGSVQAVRGVSATVSPGQVTGLLGPNGAGKTTLIRIITAYLAPSGGAASVCGHDTIDASDAARRCLGYLPESAPLYPEMSVEGYLAYRAQVFGVVRAARKAAIDRAIQRCWLPEMRTRRIGALSKGYRQRVGLAAALLHDPPVLVLDEPTSGLDPTQIREMRVLIRELATGGTGKTVLLSSHILPEVEQTCDRVLIINRGKLRADGSPDQLLESLRRSAPYSVEFAGSGADDAARGAAALRSVTGVMDVRGAEGKGRFDVVPRSDAGDLREPIARAAAAAGLLVRELSRTRPTLEQVFMSVISEEEPVAA